MFTRTSSFTYGNYQIANIDVDKINNNVALKIHIQKYEQEALRMAIGECLYGQLMDNLELDGDGYYKPKDDADEKWGWLLNGRTYESSGIWFNQYLRNQFFFFNCGCSGSNTCKTHKWEGLVSNVATVQDKDVYESILTPYVFFYWSLNNRTMNTGVGEANGKAANTTQASSKNKRVDSWNEFVQRVAFGRPNSLVSLYQFLFEHKEEFPDFKPVCWKTITYWDI